MEWIAQLFWPYDIDDSRRIWSLFLILAGRIFSTHNFHTFPQPIFILFSIFFSTFCKCRKKLSHLLIFAHQRLSIFCHHFPLFSSESGWMLGRRKFQRFPLFYVIFWRSQASVKGWKKREKKCSDWALGNDCAGFFSLTLTEDWWRWRNPDLAWMDEE